MLILKRLLNFVFHGGEGDKKNLNGRGKGGCLKGDGRVFRVKKRVESKRVGPKTMNFEGCFQIL